MAQTGFPAYSKTAASNATADSAQNWAEGMAPSAINDSARGGMASMAKWRDDSTNGSLTTGGTSTAYTVTTNTGMDALAANYQITFQVNADNGGTTTLNVDSKGAKPLRSAAGVELVAGQLKSGGIYSATYFTSNSGEWIIHSFNPVVLADSQVATAKIADAAVTNAKLANMANATVKGRATSGTGVPEDITASQALDFISSTRGNVLVRGASTWGAVGPGTQGQVLRSDGTDVALGVIPLLHVREEQAANTASTASLTNNAWTTCTLNTTRTNEINSASLTSDQISLPAGTYYAKIKTPAPQSGASAVVYKTRLRNITDSSTLLVSQTIGWSGGGAAGSSLLVEAEGRFTISGTKTIAVQFYHNLSGASKLGGNISTGYSETEVYAELFIWRVA